MRWSRRPLRARTSRSLIAFPSIRRSAGRCSPTYLTWSARSPTMAIGSSASRARRRTNGQPAAPFDVLRRDGQGQQALQWARAQRRISIARGPTSGLRDLLQFQLARWRRRPPAQRGNGSVNIDLATGAALKITQIITKLDALRNLAGRCVPIYQRVSAQARSPYPTSSSRPPAPRSQHARPLPLGCTKDDVAEPLWSLVPEGMVIGVWANAHATAAEEGQGPILPWGVLLREGLLRADSPMKSLWAGITAAAADALPCSSSYEGKTFRSWHEQPASP